MTQLFNRSSMKQRRRTLRANMTHAEWLVWEQLRTSQLGARFRRQYSIGAYVVDFYCPQRRLVIEIDGDTHCAPDEVTYDTERERFLTSLNLRVLRFSNRDVYDDPDGVLSTITAALE